MLVQKVKEESINKLRKNQNPSKGKDLTTVNACDDAPLPTAGGPEVSLVRLNWTSSSATQVSQPHTADASAVRRP
ncbi:Kinesin Heavy Chain Isoform 5A [Manis pentadactyla]|nr:Kinesin Heavy Chain Isoform 5A [Manis pentadactyla]